MEKKSLGKAGLLAGGVLALALASCGSPALFIVDGKASRARVAGEGAGERLNLLVSGSLSEERLDELAAFGRIEEVLPEIGGLVLSGKGLKASNLLAVPYVIAANPDAPRAAGPVPNLPLEDDSSGPSTWDLDAIGVTDFGGGRSLAYDGSGVYVAVIDTGLVAGWERYFPAERVARGYAASFGGGDKEEAAEQPNAWERDANSHGTQVTSGILGYGMSGFAVDGAAPKASIIPIKVLNRNGSGWSSHVAKGILRVAELKAGPLADSPVVINLSLGGPRLDALEKAAIDFAIRAGAIVVAAAGNEGAAGMDYPGAYEPVISVAALGWVGEWSAASWWRNLDVADPSSASDFYIADFSSRELPGQDLDLAAPGSWIVGPYQTNGKSSYHYLGGGSLASPHVAGVVALLCQKRPGLRAAEAEAVLEASALPLPPGWLTLLTPSGPAVYSWEANAAGAGLIDAGAALADLP